MYYNEDSTEQQAYDMQVADLLAAQRESAEEERDADDELFWEAKFSELSITECPFCSGIEEAPCLCHTADEVSYGITNIKLKLASIVRF